MYFIPLKERELGSAFQSSGKIETKTNQRSKTKQKTKQNKRTKYATALIFSVRVMSNFI